jgi:gamma-glutamyl-gamma-aminobutyrate hydrolase PuuD
MNIGLTQRIFYYNDIAYDCLEHGWQQLLSGHTHFSIANNPEQDFEKLVKDLDFIIFTGGDASPIRLKTEIRLLTECYKQNKPILGVCHGALLINQLEEGINAECEGHYNTKHNVIMNKKVYTVNSHHQNKILSLPQNFEIVAITKEGDIEAFKHKQRNIWGVVWHPERMDKPVLPNDLEKILN